MEPGLYVTLHETPHGSKRSVPVAEWSKSHMYEGVSKSFRTGHLERELQMVLTRTEW
jgi:hypothetical protein